MATERQKKAIKVVVSGGSPTEGMRQAGYAKSVIRKPKVLTGSKAWEELMEKFLPDELLAEKHKELLEVPIKIKRFKKGKLETEIEQLDSFAVSKGLDMGYKLKGKYAPERHQVEVQELSKEEKERINKALEEIG